MPEKGAACASSCCAIVNASGFTCRIELSLGPPWSRALIRVSYMFTTEVAFNVPAAYRASSCAMVTSSMPGSGATWCIGVGVVVSDWRGNFPSKPLAPAATAATPAPYLRKSRLETLLLVIVS